MQGNAKGQAVGADTDLMQLYSSRILALAAEMPFAARLSAPQGSAMRRSPQCGSKVTVDVTMNSDGRIADFGQDVKACALGQASASLSASNILGRNEQEVKAARDALAGMLAGSGERPGTPFDGFEVLTPAIDFKNRHASIMLALEATLDAMADAKTKNHCLIK